MTIQCSMQFFFLFLFFRINAQCNSDNNGFSWRIINMRMCDLYKYSIIYDQFLRAFASSFSFSFFFNILFKTLHIGLSILHYILLKYHFYLFLIVSFPLHKTTIIHFLPSSLSDFLENGSGGTKSWCSSDSDSSLSDLSLLADKIPVTLSLNLYI